MIPTPDQLTAYALGEGSPAERAAIAAYLANHPEAQAEVVAIQETASLIGSSLAGEAAPGLDPARRTALTQLPLAGVKSPGGSGKLVRFPHLVVWPGLVAAGLAVTVMTQEHVPPTRQTVPEPAALPALAAKPLPSTAPLAARTSVADGIVAAKPQISHTFATAEPQAQEERRAAARTYLRTGDTVSSTITTPPPVVASATLEPPVHAEASAVGKSLPAQVPAGEWGDARDVGAAKAPFANAMRHDFSDSGSLSQTLTTTSNVAVVGGIVGTFSTPADAIAPGERYPTFAANGWHRVTSASGDANRLSTFGADVDTASYANVRRFLRSGQIPPADAVRSEELVNAFHYHYAPPATRSVPFAVHPQVAACPWADSHRLVRIGLKGYELDRAQRPPANLVFLVDVSGSMNEPTKLPLVQRALTLLTGQLRADDRVSIVTYAGNAGVLLDSTPGENQAKILAAIDGLGAGGSTNGAGGITAAYDQAQGGFIRGGVNRVVLCTDGDFNVGASSRAALETLITERAKSGVFLTALGFGMGNYQDTTMQVLADKGNGTYAYIDSEAEARKHLVEGCTGTLVTIAKDVKIQVEFNPQRVASWRLIGYEKRALAHQDFLDDRKDAGELGAGHTVTALYEIEPIGGGLPGVPALRYAEHVAQAPTQAPVAVSAVSNDELLTVSLRWKLPDSDVSSGIAIPVPDGSSEGDADLRFAAAVAEFSLSLREPAGSWDLQRVLKVAQDTAGDDPQRQEFVDLVRTAQQLRR